MSGLAENEIIARHIQSLGEAHAACQELGRNAADDYLAPRGKHYAALKDALNKLEGSARQMAHFRGDARWLKLGMIYARLMRMCQAKYIGQSWNAFNEMLEFFGPLGRRRLEDLRDRKTGKSGLILPTPGNMDWVVMPDHKVPRRLQ